MYRSILLAIAFFLPYSPLALACPGQTGAVIFDDTFADDSGGWSLVPPFSVVTPPNLVMTLGKTNQNYDAQVITFFATEGDFCTEVSLPTVSEPRADVSAGLTFWASDYSNYYLFLIRSTTAIGFYRLSDNKWSPIFTEPNSSAVVVGSGSTNAIRVSVRKGTLDFFINGIEIKTIRAQIPPGKFNFGVHVESENLAADTSIRFLSFRVTTPAP